MAKTPVITMPFTDLPGSGLLESLTPEEVRRSFHFVTPEGVEYHGGEAIRRAARLTRLAPIAALLSLPPLWPLHELAYGVVATLRRSLGLLHAGLSERALLEPPRRLQSLTFPAAPEEAIA